MQPLNLSPNKPLLFHQSLKTFKQETLITLITSLFISSIFFSCKKENSFEDSDPIVSSSTELISADSSGSINIQARSAAALSSAAAYEGFGANAVGGSNSTTIYHVTNLNSSGTGSLKNGIGSNKTIVFDVSGTIYGTGIDLVNISYLTIDGTTAPSPGITLDNLTSSGGPGPYDDVISFDGSNTHHCILKGIHTTKAANDGINVVSDAHDIMITNCSSYNNTDGEIDIAGANNVTVQYCILGASATDGPGPMLITATNVTVHHNLFSPARANTPGERCPLVHCNYSPIGNPNADIRNNLIWKFGRDNGTGSGYGTAIAYNATGNIINNYYYSAGTSPGSATNADDGYGGGASGLAYMSGNVSGNSGVNANSENNHAIFPAATVTTQDACTAASLVLANAGPRPLNATDQALVSAVTMIGCNGTPPNQSPIVDAGTTQTITLPVSSVTLTGTASDPDGTIASYLWTKISGTGGAITTSSAITTTVTGLTAGTYVFKLRVTDNGGAIASDDITVIVNPAIPVNQLPVVNAGTNQTITLPINSVTLTGTASDPDGTIASYLWTKISGTGGTITTPSAATTTVTGLTAGTYVFNLKATDNRGATATANITVTVNLLVIVNLPPVVNAGTNRLITLPISSVTLTGTASDPDGTIASYLWTKISGTGGTITTPSAATTTVTGLTAGTYVFSLKATDNLAATATANVTVIVNPAAPVNLLPVVNAGTNQTITLPVNSVTLAGTASDPDGTIASYLWTKISGTGGTITTPSTATTTVTGLTAGMYVFSLKATDNLGATATANVTITVNDALAGNGYGTLTYSQPYDISSSVNTNMGLRNSVSLTTYLTGPGSFRSEVRAGDAGTRSEMSYTAAAQNPAEGVLEYDVYYENWNSFDGGGHSIEWMPQTSGAGALLSLQNFSGKFDVVRAIGATVTHQPGTLMTCASNTWYKLRWEFKWSTGTDGYARLYINNVLYYSYTGKTSDGSTQSLRIGQFRWPNSGNTMQTTSVCYYDNLKIYKK